MRWSCTYVCSTLNTACCDCSCLLLPTFSSRLNDLPALELFRQPVVSHEPVILLLTILAKSSTLTIIIWCVRGGFYLIELHAGPNSTDTVRPFESLVFKAYFVSFYTNLHTVLGFYPGRFCKLCCLRCILYSGLPLHQILGHCHNQPAKWEEEIKKKKRFNSLC